MRISTKGRYGTRAMLSLAAKYNTGLTHASQIATEEGISLKYLENLLSSLRGAGLVISERGLCGGYTLARPPTQINMLEILTPLGESLEIVHCTVDEERCERSSICATREVWKEILEATNRVLRETTLDDLLNRQKVLLEENKLDK